MTRYLLDTGSAGDYIHRRRGAYERAREAVARGHRVGIGLPVLAELWYGVENSSTRERNAERLRRVLPDLIVWPLTEPAHEASCYTPGKEDDEMSLLISDETLRAAGMNEQEARLEIACRWFDAGKLSFGHAASFAGLTVVEFEAQLEARGIPRFRYTEDMLDQDVETLKKLGRW